MALEKYHQKRDFSKTHEPKGEENYVSRPRFVIQEHEASHHHFDFRLEMPEDAFRDPENPVGPAVLKSWAIPKSIPTEPKIKRLAVQTEDHPVEYFDFEGQIPEGEYGAGTVRIWDQGKYKILSLDKNALKIHLSGKKLDGDYVLVNARFQKNNQWLIFKV